jgi:hypothetical protein
MRDVAIAACHSYPVSSRASRRCISPASAILPAPAVGGRKKLHKRVVAGFAAAHEPSTGDGSEKCAGEEVEYEECDKETSGNRSRRRVQAPHVRHFPHVTTIPSVGVVLFRLRTIIYVRELFSVVSTCWFSRILFYLILFHQWKERISVSLSTCEPSC